MSANTRRFGAAAALLLAAFVLSLCVGRYPLSLAAVLRGEGMASRVFWRLRLPRTLAVCCAGMALGLAGAVYQALFANPLAAPDVMGVSAGATLGAAVATVLLGGALTELLAFAGGMAALALALGLARLSGGRGMGALVLAGVLVSALCRTGIMLLKTLADSAGQLAAIEYFTMGSFSGITVRMLPGMLGGVALGMAALTLLRRQIPLLALGGEEAASLGVRVGVTRAVVLLAATLMVCAVSARAGVVAFMPLLAPHAARLMLGGAQRGRLPLSALVGGALLLGADVAARLTPGAELPVSVLTTLLGVPMIAWLMAGRSGRRADD